MGSKVKSFLLQQKTPCIVGCVVVEAVTINKKETAIKKTLLGTVPFYLKELLSKRYKGHLGLALKDNKHCVVVTSNISIGAHSHIIRCVSALRFFN